MASARKLHYIGVCVQGTSFHLVDNIGKRILSPKQICLPVTVLAYVPPYICSNGVLDLRFDESFSFELRTSLGTLLVELIISSKLLKFHSEIALINCDCMTIIRDKLYY